MGNGDSPKPDPSKIPLSPVVAAASQSIADMYNAAIEAMKDDTKALISKNGASNPPANDSMKSLTAELIKLMRSCLQKMQLRNDEKKP